MASGPSIDLSSFLDIMTCVLGILILIILLTGIDASEIVVLVATPKELTGDDRAPVFFECRGNRLYHINMESAKAAADRTTAAIWEKVEGSEHDFQAEAATTILTLPEGYRLDYVMTLIGRFTFRPDPGHEGYNIEGQLSHETSDRWFGGLLSRINPERQFICFFVRPDSFAMFQKARNLAWGKNINVSCELLTLNDPIVFGPGGQPVTVQ